jgi:hypothetical protein
VRFFKHLPAALLAVLLLAAIGAPVLSQASEQSPTPAESQPKPDSSAAKKDATKSVDPQGKAAAPATAPGASVAASKPAATPQPRPANGGGMVWVNTDTGVYHKPGSRYYGKTKVGKYMTEADAKKAGYRPAKGSN